MKIQQSLDIESIVNLLLGVSKLNNVELWFSRTRALSKAITFVENDPLLAPKLLAHTSLKFSENKENSSRVIGITGLPGAGKSTITNLIIRELRLKGKSVAVFAVDPSSSLSGGAILGDRVRMQEHFKDKMVFIRSMGARGALGGVALATRSAIRLASILEFDFILVETVGIGQSESEITNIADTTLLVLMPNSGDEIQLMKAGILQLANIYIINKCDLADPMRMMQEISENTVPINKNVWHPLVLKSSAANCEGIKEIVDGILLHQQYEIKNSIGKEIRQQRLKKEILQNILMLAEFKFKNEIEKIDAQEIKMLHNGATTAMFLAQKIFDKNVISESIKNEN